MELIYTTRNIGFEPGKHYRNPRYFDRIEQGATTVIVDGDWPVVVAAYEKSGVEVKVIGAEQAAKPGRKAAKE